MTAPTIAQRLDYLASRNLLPSASPLPPPAYLPDASRDSRILLGLECFARHMTNEGHQLQYGLELAGYELWGPHFDNDEADVAKIIAATDPTIAIMQDKREWDKNNGSCLDPTAGFENSESLAADPSIFRVTICKDAHGHPEYHRAAAAEIGCHAWICYYHPDLVAALSGYVRPEHLIRTYHSLDIDELPEWKPAGERDRCLISGAASGLYPLRQRIIRQRDTIRVKHLLHPGYHARGSHTSRYLETLNGFKVSICTASAYGYALRKIIESVACGCVVITDLPPDDPLPEIDAGLVRVHPDIPPTELRELIDLHEAKYDEEKQRHLAARCTAFYNYRRRGFELAAAIEKARREYSE